MCVNQAKPSYGRLSYIYMYFWKFKSFLANLWSIPPRKCNMSLQQIPLMMQQCLRTLWYYFSRVYHHFYATCVSKRTAILQQKCFKKSAPWNTQVVIQQKPLWMQTICLKNAFVCLRKFCCVYDGPMKTNGVFLLQESVTLPYLSGSILINPKQIKTQKKIWQLVQRPE